MEKLMKTATILSRVFKVIESVLFALAIAAAVFVILITVGWLLKWDASLLGNNFESLTVGYLSLTLADTYTPDPWTVLLQAAINLALACGCCIISGIGIKYIRAILVPMSQGKPFAPTVSLNLKILAIISVVLGVAINLFSVVELLTYSDTLQTILISEKVTYVGIDYNFDCSFLVISGVLLLLSYIFRYGAQLQQLSDETL